MTQAGEQATRTSRAAGVARGDVFICRERCKGCAFCVEFCPTHVLEMSGDYNPKGYHYPCIARPEACSGCDLCGMFCPDFAIYGVRRKKGAAVGRADEG